MDINLIITSVIGLAIGGISVYLLKNKKTDSADTNMPADTKKLQQNNLKLKSEKTNLEEKLKQLKKTNSHTSSDTQELEKTNLKLKSEKTKLEERLKDLEKPNQDSSSIDTKTIKNLKNDIDELEIDIEDLETRSKKFKSEKEDAEEELEQSERKLGELSKETEELNQENKKQKTEIELTSQRLEFVNNILSAKSNKDFESVIQKVNAIDEYIKENIVEHFAEKQFLKEEIYTWVISELKPWIKDKKVIAIVGEFSAGKTSIVNRILSQDDPNTPLLPTNSKETTAIPTYISYGLDFNCQFYSPDQELKNIHQNTFEKVTKSVIDKTDISSLIKYFVLSYNNKNLKNISILDTPGFASNSSDIIKRTTDVVREANALFWVIDANTGDINQTSIEVMQKHLHDMPIYFILNKSDTKSDKDLTLLENKIKATANKNKIPYEAIIRFSNKEDISVLIKHIKKIPSKKDENIIQIINEVLQGWISDEDNEIKELKKDKNQCQENLRVYENNFKIIEEDVSYNAITIDKITNLNDGGWTGLGRKRYEIEAENYDDFVNSINGIIGLSTEIPEQVNKFKKAVEEDYATEIKLHDEKNHKEKLEKTRNEFLKKVKAYNPNLLN